MSAPRTRSCWKHPSSETLFTGYTRLYIPVVVSAPGHKSGEIVHVRLGEYDGERVRAALC